MTDDAISGSGMKRSVRTDGGETAESSVDGTDQDETCTTIGCVREPTKKNSDGAPVCHPCWRAYEIGKLEGERVAKLEDSGTEAMNDG